MDLEKFQRIQKKLQQLIQLDSEYKIFGSKNHRYQFFPPKSESDIFRFENTHQLKLPEEYRYFLTHLANGGPGPYYGLYSLEKGIEEAEKYSSQKGDPIKNSFTKPFFMEHESTKKFLDHYYTCIEEGDDDEIVYPQVPDPLCGVIFLNDYGCGSSYILVVQGEQAGTIWLLGETLSPCFKDRQPWGFFDWYEDWLDRSLEKLTSPQGAKSSISSDRTIINYDGRKLSEVPQEVWECKNLKKLVLSRTEIAVFPKEIFQLKKLRTLDLSMTPIVDIPEEISELKHLKKLRLNYNHHTTLPESLSTLAKLEELSLQYAYEMETLPDVVTKLKGLKRLLVAHGSTLKNLPARLGDLRNLEVLHMNDCPLIEHLPESVGDLEKLTSLFIGQTCIKKLPENFEKLKSLKFLGLDIEELDLAEAVEKINHLPALTFLQISHQLHYPDAFRELKHITTLAIRPNYKLWHQGYKTLPVPEATTLIPHLQKLILTNNNQALSLPENIGDMKILKELEIYSTSIKDFPASMEKLPHFESLSAHVEKNPQSPFGITPAAKAKLLKWFPQAKISAY